MNEFFLSDQIAPELPARTTSLMSQRDLDVRAQIEALDASTAAGEDLDGSPLGRGFTSEEIQRRMALVAELTRSQTEEGAA